MAFHLPRFQREADLIDKNGRPTQTFHVWWSKVAKNLEDQFNIAVETMSDLAPFTFFANSSGVVTPSVQLPKSFQCRRYSNTTEVTTSSTWSMVVKSGSVTASIGAATGTLTVTAITSNASIDVTSVRMINGQSVSLTKTLALFLNIAPADSSGSGGTGGTTASSSALSSYNSTTMAAVSPVLSVTVGSNGKVDLSAPLSFTTSATSPGGSFAALGIWQWDSTGAGAWTDIGTATNSTSNCTVTLDGGTFYADPGSITVNSTKTSLGVGSTQKFRFQMKNSSGTRTMYPSGTVSAVGS